MDMDDLEPQRQTPKKKDLSDMSIAALHEYVAELEAEVERARATIRDKEAARTGAESFFRS